MTSGRPPPLDPAFERDGHLHSQREETVIKLSNMKAFRRESDGWTNTTRKIVRVIPIPSAEFLGWDGKHHVIQRDRPNTPAHIPILVRALIRRVEHTRPTRMDIRTRGKARSVNALMWLRQVIQVKELPPRRRLGTGSGTDGDGRRGWVFLFKTTSWSGDTFDGR